MNHGGEAVKLADVYFVKQPPCCLEFCPSFASCFILGTYNLKENSDESGAQVRDGSLMLCEVEHGARFREIQTISTKSAILDIHFSPFSRPKRDVLGVVTSTGQFEVYVVGPEDDDDDDNVKDIAKTCQFSDLASIFGSRESTSNSVQESAEPTGSTTLRLKFLYSVQLFENSILITSFAWDTICADRIICTTTEGQVAWCSIGGSNHQQSQNPEQQPCEEPSELAPGHELQAWIAIPAATLYEDGVLSGGDDAKLVFSPLVEHRGGTCSAAFSWSDRRTHGAGVTALTPIPTRTSPNSVSEKNRLVLTGSYDDHIRLLRLPSVSQIGKRPEVLAERNMEGGVWRIAIADTHHELVNGQFVERFLLLLSCMYAGACLVRLVHSVDQSDGADAELETWSFEEICWFKEHESMCYASSPVPLQCREVLNSGEIGHRYTFVSTSFYDKRVCLWSIELSPTFTSRQERQHHS